MSYLIGVEKYFYFDTTTQFCELFNDCIDINNNFEILINSVIFR